jgi:hypothetical protein
MAALSKDELLNRPPRRGRPHGTAHYWNADWLLCAEIEFLIAAGMTVWQATGVVAPKAAGDCTPLRSKRVRLHNLYRLVYRPWCENRTLFQRAALQFSAIKLPEFQLLPAIKLHEFTLAAREISETFAATRAAVIASQAETVFSREVQAAMAAADAQARRWTEQYKEVLAGIKLTPPGIKLTFIA